MATGASNAGTRTPASGRPARAWVVVIGLVLVLGGLALRWLGAGQGGAPALPPHIVLQLTPVERVPAAAGDLADCSLLLVTLDTTRADHLECYGNEAVRTPTLDRLAARGVLFSDAVAVAPLTLPAHASLMTGLYPARHGVRANGLFRLDERFETLAERLRAEGFRTGAVVSSVPLARPFGLDQGFEHYDDDLSGEATPLPRHYRERTALPTSERARAWLRTVRGERFFLWVHFFDPHRDYRPPSPFAEAYARNPYDGEIAYVDGALGYLLRELDELGLGESTLVAVIGDHGEGLGEHSETTHAYQAYDSTLHVPLILAAGRRLGGGVRCSRPISQVDVGGLLLALLGCGLPEGLDGADLLDPGSVESPRFFETLTGRLDFGWEPLFGVYAGDYKYIHSSSPELYDRARDPAERENLVEREPETAARLRALVSEAFGDTLASTPTPNLSPSPRDLAQLEGLGYLGGGGGAPAATPIPPQAMMPVLTRVALAEDEAMPVAERIAGLRAVLDEHPDFYPAWKSLANVQRETGNLEEAGRALERCLALSPGAPWTVHDLALVRASQGLDVEAVRLLEPLVARYPSFVEARYLYGTVLGRLKRLPEAIEHLRAVFELAPDHERCLEHLVGACLIAGRGDELIALLEAHLAAHPGSEKVRATLEQLRAQAGGGAGGR